VRLTNHVVLTAPEFDVGRHDSDASRLRPGCARAVTISVGGCALSSCAGVARYQSSLKIPGCRYLRASWSSSSTVLVTCMYDVDIGGRGMI
jgi:hypothetical protein